MTPFLETISEDLRLQIEKCGRMQNFAENEEIFAGGVEARALPVIISGSVKMIHFLEPGKEITIDVFGAGEMFAVPPVFDGGRYPATAIATGETRLLLIGRNDFIELLRESSELSFEVIRWMCNMLREKTATIQNLASTSPEVRVARVLLRLAAKYSGEFPVRIVQRRQDIARMAGLTTETTIRTVRKLADRGLIAIVHGKIIVEDPLPLERYVES